MAILNLHHYKKSKIPSEYWDLIADYLSCFDKELIKFINLDKKRTGDLITIVKVTEPGSYILDKIKIESIKEYLKGGCNA